MFPGASPDSLFLSSHPHPTPVRAAFLLSKASESAETFSAGAWRLAQAAPRGRALGALLSLWSTSVLEETLVRGPCGWFVLGRVVLLCCSDSACPV